MGKEKGIHDGHKQRFRNRFALDEYEFDHFNDHEVLEFMLSFVIIRQDTNELAHRLLDRFKTLHQVFSADPQSLMEVPGVGERTASFIKAQYALFRRCSGTEYFTNHQYLLDMEEFLKYLKTLFVGKSQEELYAIMFDGKNKLLASKKINSGDIANVIVDTHKIIKLLLDYNAAAVILAHNHPSGNSTPSNEDIEVTYKLKELFERLHIRLEDHMIVSEGEVYSLFNDKRFRMMNIGIKIR